MDINNVIKKKKTHPFSKETEVQETKEHTCLNFLIEKSKLTHRHSCYCKIVQEAKFFFFFKDNNNSVSSCEEACHITSSLTHSLRSFKSPDIRVSATRRPKTRGEKSFCTNNENKAKVRVHRGHTPLGRAAPDGSRLGARPPFTRGLAWGVLETIPDNNNNKKPHKRRGRPAGGGARDRLGPLDPRTRRARWGQIDARSRQRRCAKTENLQHSSCPHPFCVSFSVC